MQLGYIMLQILVVRNRRCTAREEISLNSVVQAVDAFIQTCVSPLTYASTHVTPWAGEWFDKPLTAALFVSIPHAFVFRCLPQQLKPPTAVLLGFLLIRWYSGPAAWVTCGLVASSYVLTQISVHRTARLCLAWGFVVIATYCVHLVGEFFPNLSNTALYSIFMAFSCGQRIISLASNFDMLRTGPARAAAVRKLGKQSHTPFKQKKFAAKNRDLVRRLSLADAPVPSFVQYMAWMLHPGTGVCGAFHEWADYYAALRGTVSSTDTYYGVLAGNGARLSGGILHGASRHTQLPPLRDCLWDAVGAFLYGAAGIASIVLLWETFSMHGFMLGMDERWNPWWGTLFAEFPHVQSWTLPGSFADAWDIFVFIVQRGVAVWWERGFSITAWIPAAALLGRLWVFHWFIAQPVRYGWWHLGEGICIVSGIG